LIFTEFEDIPKNYYNIIYADPPWQFKTWSNKGRGRCPKYNTLSVEQMLDVFPVKSITQDDCVIFMWGTWPKLKSALELLEGWGFEYKTGVFDWGKVSKKGFDFFKQLCENSFSPTLEDYFSFLDEIIVMGTGYWSRGNSEYCFLGTKGKPKRKDRKSLIFEEETKIARAVRQLLLRPRTTHGKKPPEIRKRIIDLMGDIPRIELFARDTFDGWDVFGNEIE